MTRERVDVIFGMPFLACFRIIGLSDSPSLGFPVVESGSRLIFKGRKNHLVVSFFFLTRTFFVARCTVAFFPLVSSLVREIKDDSAPSFSYRLFGDFARRTFHLFLLLARRSRFSLVPHT